MKKIILLVLTVLTLSSCSKPIPNDKLSYVGEWQSNEMYLLILPDGSVTYERLQNGGTTSINASIKEFVGEDFIVGFAFFTTTFDVMAAPYKVGGKWIMVVDGVELTKSSY